MMAGNGGYQRPGTPATVSGVGANSARTDGQPSPGDMVQAAKYLSGEKYGQNANLNQQEQAVPLAGGLQAKDVKAPSLAVANSNATATPSSFQPLTEPGDPNVPLTHGLPVGPGANSLPGFNPPTLGIHPETGMFALDGLAQGQYQNGINVLSSLANGAGSNSGSLQYLLGKIKEGY